MRGASRLLRGYHMLKAVPAAQLARRLQLVAWRKLERHLPVRPPAQTINWHPQLPQPVFPPRKSQWKEIGERSYLELAWGQYPITVPMDWAPSTTTRLGGSWRTRLNYMEYLEGADDAHFAALIDDWCEQVRPQGEHRYGWRAFNLAIRAVVWIQQWALRRDRLDAAFGERMAQSLAHQLTYLERYLETDLRGNHLVKNVKALLWAGSAFEGDPARHWRQLGERLLARELAEQVLPDGTHYERSPPYHCQVFADFLECRQVLSPGCLRDQLDEALACMASALGWLVHPDGQPALFNDGGSSMAYAPEICLNTYAGEASLPQGTFALHDAGYFGWRRGQDYLIADCGKLAPDYLIGHGHGDILSFEWSLAGQRVIVDQGTYQNLGGERRVITRATRSHNTIAIDGFDQGDFFGAHRCGLRPRPEVLRFDARDDGFILEGRHDGYRRLQGAPWHRRRFDVHANGLTIEDEIIGTSNHRGDGSFLLHPDCIASLDGGHVILDVGGSRIVVTADAELRLEPAEWFPDLYCALPCQRIAFQFEGGSGPCRTRFEVSSRR